MSISRRSRFALGALLSAVLCAFIVYSEQMGYIHTIGGATGLLLIAGFTFLAISLLGTILVYNGRLKIATQIHPMAYVSFLLLALGGVTGLWAGLSPDRPSVEWSSVGIYFAAINLVIMFVVPLYA